MELSNLPGELELGLPPPDRTWWRRSHVQVLSSAPRWLPDAKGPRDLENRVCALLGHQWHRRIIAGHGGLLRGGWLEELLDRWDTSHTTDDAASRDTDPDADDSDVGGRVVGSWLLLRGLAIGGMAEAEAGIEHGSAATAMSIEKPWLSEQVTLAVSGLPLIARDAYGSRSALFAPFEYRGASTGPDPHWYCWDLDTCGSPIVVGAGVFDDLAPPSTTERPRSGGTASRSTSRGPATGARRPSCCRSWSWSRGGATITFSRASHQSCARSCPEWGNEPSGLPITSL